MIHPTFAETLKTTSQKHVILNAVQLQGLTFSLRPLDMISSCPVDQDLLKCSTYLSIQESCNKSQYLRSPEEHLPGDTQEMRSLEVINFMFVLCSSREMVQTRQNIPICTSFPQISAIYLNNSIDQVDDQTFLCNTKQPCRLMNKLFFFTGTRRGPPRLSCNTLNRKVLGFVNTIKRSKPPTANTDSLINLIR